VIAMRGYDPTDIVIEMAKLDCEARERIAVKRASEQLGEAWVGLDDRRQEPNPMRGPDRRHAA